MTPEKAIQRAKDKIVELGYTPGSEHKETTFVSVSSVEKKPRKISGLGKTYDQICAMVDAWLIGGTWRAEWRVYDTETWADSPKETKDDTVIVHDIHVRNPDGSVHRFIETEETT